MANYTPDDLDSPADQRTKQTGHDLPEITAEELDQQDTHDHPVDEAVPENSHLARVNDVLRVFQKRENYFQHYNDNYAILEQELTEVSQIDHYLRRFFEEVSIYQMYDVLDVRHALIQHKFRTIPDDFLTNHVHWRAWVAACERSAAEMSRTETWLSLRHSEHTRLPDAWNTLWNLIETNEPYESKTMKSCLDRCEEIRVRIQFLTDCFHQSCLVYRFLWDGEKPEWMEWDIFSWPDPRAVDEGKNESTNSGTDKSEQEHEAKESENQKPEHAETGLPILPCGHDSVLNKSTERALSSGEKGRSTALLGQEGTETKENEDTKDDQTTNDAQVPVTQDTQDHIVLSTPTAQVEEQVGAEPLLTAVPGTSNIYSGHGDGGAEEGRLPGDDENCLDSADQDQAIEDDIAELLAAKAHIEAQLAAKRAQLKATGVSMCADDRKLQLDVSGGDTTQAREAASNERDEAKPQNSAESTGEAISAEEGTVADAVEEKHGSTPNDSSHTTEDNGDEGTIPSHETVVEGVDQDSEAEVSIFPFLYPARKIHWQT